MIGGMWRPVERVLTTQIPCPPRGTQLTAEASFERALPWTLKLKLPVLNSSTPLLARASAAGTKDATTLPAGGCFSALGRAPAEVCAPGNTN